MIRHRTDVLSLLAGLLFVGLAAASWAGLVRPDMGLPLRWFPPAILILAGLGLLAGVTRRTGADPATPEPDASACESPPEDG